MPPIACWSNLTNLRRCIIPETMSHEPESVVSPTTTTGPELTFTLAAINNEPAELDASSVVPPRNPRDERRGSRATDLDGMDAKDRAV